MPKLITAKQNSAKLKTTHTSTHTKIKGQNTHFCTPEKMYTLHEYSQTSLIRKPTEPSYWCK